jgi:hypothetical protein
MAQVLSKPVDPIVEVEEDFEGQLQRLEREATLAAFKDVEEMVRGSWFCGTPWKELVSEMEGEDGWDGPATHHGHCASEEEAEAEFKEKHGLNLSDVNWECFVNMIKAKAASE